MEALVTNQDLDGIRAAVRQDAKLLEWIPKPLHHASREGLVQVMDVLMDLGADVASEENGITALSVACTNGHVNAARLLLDRGADVNYSGYSDKYPLVEACRENQVEVVRMLLSRDVELKVREKALQLAVQKNNVNLARLFVEHGMDFIFLRTPPRYFDQIDKFLDEGKRELTPVGLSHPKTRSADMIELLLDHGGGKVDDINEHGQSVLIQASLHGDMELAQLLISRGADVNFEIETYSFFTPLAAACERNQAPIVDLLLRHGADGNHIVKDNERGSLLAITCETGAMACFQRLLDYGVNLHAPGIGSTAFDMDCVPSHFGMTKILLERGVLTKSNEHMQTYLQMALRSACGASNLDMVKYFIENGAVADSDYLTEAFPRSELCAEYLLDHGVTYDPRGSSGEKLLHTACLRGWSRIVERILKEGGDANCRDSHGKTPLLNAACNRSDQDIEKSRFTQLLLIAKLLVSRGAEVNAVDRQGLTAFENLGGIRFPEPVPRGGTFDWGSWDFSLKKIINEMEDFAVFLIDQGATFDPNLRRHATILRNACKCGCAKLTRTLLRRFERGPRVYPYLETACKHRRTEIVKILLNHDAQRRERFLGSRYERSERYLGVEHLYSICSGEPSKEQWDIVNLLLQINQGFRDDQKLGYLSKALQHACGNGLLPIAGLLVRHGADVNLLPSSYSPSYEALTCLMRACKEGHLDTVRWLLEHGASIDMQSENGWTALIIACCAHQSAIATLLIEHGANVNHGTSFGWTALHLASSYKDVNLVRLLLKQGASVNSLATCHWTSLMSACCSGSIETVNVLLESGADRTVALSGTEEKLKSSFDSLKHFICIRHYPFFHLPHGKICTALSVACEAGHERIVQLLVSHADVVQVSGASDLAIPYIFRKFSLADIFHRRGIGLNFSDARGRTALMTVCERTSTSRLLPAGAQALIDRGADLHARDNNGATPLSIMLSILDCNVRQFGCDDTEPEPASSSDDTSAPSPRAPSSSSTREHSEELAKFLLERGADPNVQDRLGMTPLMQACSRGAAVVVRFLLQQGVDSNMKDLSGRTALMHAIRNLHSDIVEKLIQDGASLDMHDAQVSLFDVALEFRRHSTSRAEEMISWLFNRGAYMDFSCLKSSKAQTALKIAYDAGFVEVLDLITAPRTHGSGLHIVADVEKITSGPKRKTHDAHKD